MAQHPSGVLTRHTLRAVAERALAHSPLQYAASAVSKRRLCVLAYHGVPESAPFSKQLAWLRANTTLLSLEDVARCLLDGGDLPDRSVLLTFDDGERSVLENAAPLLCEHGTPSVVFVVAGLVGTHTPFWWTEVDELVRAHGRLDASGPEVVRRLKLLSNDARLEAITELRGEVAKTVQTAQLTADELRTLEAGGMTVGNHSLSHPCLDLCDDATLLREVEESHELLTRMLGHPPTAFAYPNGNWDQRVRHAVEATGYGLAFAFDHKLVAWNVDPLAVSRVRVDATAPMARFRILASGLHSRVHALRGRS